MTDLRERLEAPQLDPDVQWRLLGELQTKLSADPHSAAVRTLLSQFARRPDLMQSVARAAHAALGADAPPPDETSLPPPRIADLPEPRPWGRRWWWLWVAGALVVAATGVGGFIALNRDEDGGDQLGPFCDRARSEDSLSDRAVFTVAEPEGDPAELETLYGQVRDEMAEMVELAPAEVRQSALIVKEAWDAEARVLGDSSWDLVTAMPTILTNLAEQNVSAQTEFSDYLETQCGIDWEAPTFTDVSTAARGMGVLWGAGFGVRVSTVEAECFEQAILGEIDGARVLLLFTDNAALPTANESSQITETLEGCVEPSRLASGYGTFFVGLPGVDEPKSQCLATEILGDVTLSGWIEAITIQQPSDELVQQLTDIAGRCDVDVRVLLPLVGG